MAKESFMGMEQQLIEALLGGEEAKPFDAKEETARVAGSTSGAEFAANAGGMAGAAIGSIFGPVGSLVGGAIGSKAGEAVASAGSAPAGPGATIESGHTSPEAGPLSEGAASLAHSFQQIAVRGLQNRAAPSGRGKTF